MAIPRLFIILNITFLFFFVSSAEAKQTPEQFLNSIYAHYQGDPKIARGLFIGNDEAAFSVFDPWLADHILKDAADAEKNKQAPALDGDPFVDAQEWDIKSFKIDVKHKTAKKADAYIDFTNLNISKHIHVYLVHLPAGWRIHDIYWNDEEGSLRGLYEGK